MAVIDRTEAELSKLFIETGIDMSKLPDICTAEQLGPVLGVTVGALANDRYRHVGIPFVKHGKRVRYLRVDVARYLIANRTTHASA
jgi:hypothetical protein